MNTKVKVGIASVIVAALVALIVLDQKTTPRTDGTGDPTTAAPSSPTPDDKATMMRQDDVRLLIDKARETFVTPPITEGTHPPPGIKNPEPPPGGKEPSSTVQGEEYVIQPGDTLETIAEAKYGSRTFAGFLGRSNPSVRPTALRVGKTLILPPKPERKTGDAVADLTPSAGGEAPVAVVNSQKVYTVQPGDTLSGISTKVYNTVRHVDRIFEANRDRIADPSTLYVGTKLVMPDLPVRAVAGASSGTVATATPAPASGKTHAVQQGDSLWKIAERYAGERGVGILEMIQTLVQANPDKLKDEKTMLRLGWQLIVPE